MPRPYPRAAKLAAVRPEAGAALADRAAPAWEEYGMVRHPVDYPTIHELPSRPPLAGA